MSFRPVSYGIERERASFRTVIYDTFKSVSSRTVIYGTWRKRVYIGTVIYGKSSAGALASSILSQVGVVSYRPVRHLARTECSVYESESHF